jgi:hypothetical protein
MKKKNIVKIILVIVVLFLFYRFIYDGTVSIKSSLDNNIYKVRKGSDSQLRADYLAFISAKLDIIVKSLKNNPMYINDPAVQRLVKNWESGVSIKETGLLEPDAAYVINKKYMSFCLQDSPYLGKLKTTSIEDTNLITYVGIHELSHIMSISTDHGEEFIKNFNFLLNYSKGLMFTNPFTNTTEPLYISLKSLKTADNFCGVKLENSIN